MAANGVIGISAQIVESSDIGGKQKSTPDMSLLQRITGSFQNMRKDWKKMVGNKGTGLFYLLLGSSKIVQGVMGQVFQMFVALLELMMPIFIPTLVWIIENLAQLVQLVQNVVAGITETFKEVYSVAYEAIQTVISAGWPGVESLFGLGQPVGVQAEVDAFYTDRLIGTPLSQDEIEQWARLRSGGLILGGPIKTSDWDNEPKGTYLKEFDIDEGFESEVNTDPELSWVYAGGAPTPPGGVIDSGTVEKLIDSGDITVVDSKFNDDDDEENEKGFFSWTDNIEPFGWKDITGWMEGDITGNISWDTIFTLMLGTYDKNQISGEDLLKEVIDKSVDGEDAAQVGKGAYPRADDVRANKSAYEEQGFWSGDY
tara:strand:- start:2386 stop:3495 length:1110 start_codon:yes stop_codon:yes gene_type:complete